MKNPLTIAVSCAMVLAVGCDEPAPAKTPRKQALESITQDIFEPMLEQLHGAAEALDGAASELCDRQASERRDADLQAAREAWSDANVLWKRTDVMSFGPALMSPYRFASDIDFWPARVGDIDAVLGAEASATASDEDAGAEPGAAPSPEQPELPETLTVSQKGLPAIEYLLFARGDDTLGAFREPAQGDHRCAYLRRMTEALVRDTAELERVFTDDFALDFTLARNPNDRYDSVNDAFGELVNNMIYSVETVRGTRLAKPLGLSLGGVPQPDDVEARFSDQSIQSASAVLDGVRMVFFGEVPGGGASAHGIHSVLQGRGMDLRDAYQARHDAAIAALEAIPEPLRQAVTDDRDSVEAARAAITELLMLVQVDIAQALSVTATFGRNDGDGD